MKKNILLIVSLVCFLGCTASVGSTPSYTSTYASVGDSDFIKANYKATKDLVASLTQLLESNTPIIVSTVVNIDELTESSRLGRTISEQVGAKLTHLGFKVIELKMRSNIFVKRNEGELLLSREISEVMRNHRAQAVVVGTYSVSTDFVYVNLKMVSQDKNVIIAAHDYSLPMTKNIASLLKRSRR